MTIPFFYCRHLLSRCSRLLLYQRLSLAFSTAPASNSVRSSINRHENALEAVSFNLLFLSCARTGLVKPLHALLLVSGRADDVILATKLINLYADTNDMASSRHAFDRIPEKNLFSWSTMISGYAKNSLHREAVDCFYDLISSTALHPDSFTLLCILKCCEGLMDGTKFHCWVLKLGFENDFSIGGSLIRMYTKFGVVNDACTIFQQMPVRDLAAWNAMLSAFCRNAKPVEALAVLQEMLLEGVKMDDATVSSVLSLCAPMNNLCLGRLMHVYATKSGLVWDVCVSNALISMYEKLDCIWDARQIFDSMMHRDLVTWNTIITAYKQNNDPLTALSLFTEMKEIGIQFDVPILVNLASLVAQSGDVDSARSVHGFVLRREWILEDDFTGSAILDMYAKLGRSNYAKYVFDGMTAQDVISWSALITGFAQTGLADEAIELFRTMAQSDVLIDDRAFVSVLPAISSVRALREGVTIHGKTVRLGLQSNVFLGTCLVDMYAKCGRIDEAMHIFEEIPGRNTFMWNAIISAHGINGKSDKAFVLFQEMQEEGIKPDQVTYVCLLSACSRAGLVDEGHNFFSRMKKDHGIEPNLKHYACMVDLLSRAGHLDAAFDFIRDMPLSPDANVWSSLLRACTVHKNVNMKSFISDDLLQI
ncbi:hypothetical protein H6P81_011010 [Aristolochia fimbriata]|uniref:Pentatricopeptide repeat-containing protein n=1 Tax=Aristolochia fimbriata TaxID=158543 RepID=A0AAV7ESH2_ARIFI|nr:hypothetical protein H6P81_011010 [Aristolochia fimbriata]